MLSMTGVRANNNIRLTRLQTAFALNLPLNHFKFFKLFSFFFFLFFSLSSFNFVPQHFGNPYGREILDKTTVSKI